MPHWLQVLLVVTFVASVLQSLITAYDGNTLRENPSYRPEGSGGILYTLRSGTPSYNHENKRGDVVAKTDGSGALTYQAQYEAFGKQVATSGSTLDRQKSNSKDTDPSGLVDEGMRYRELETGMFINRDPAGFELMMGEDYWMINGRKVQKANSPEASLAAASWQMSAAKDQSRGSAPTMSASAAAGGEDSDDSKFYERVHVAGGAEPNLYTYVRQNPWTGFDPEGLATVTITDTNDKTTTLNDVSNKQIRDTVGKMPDHSVKKITITGHATAFSEDTGKHGKSDQGISISGIDSKGEWQVTFDDNGQKVSDVLAPKMADKSEVHLNGCNTANDRKWMMIGSKDNISNSLSKEMPGVTVTGNRGFAVGDQWYGHQFSKELHGVGVSRSYVNGKEQ
jgi:hypothetical protein